MKLATLDRMSVVRGAMLRLRLSYKALHADPLFYSKS